LNSESIINVDFPEELINKYRIHDNSIIININEKINLKSKRFNGININDYRIKIPYEYKLKGFQDEIIYESLMYGKKYEIIKDKIEKDKIVINNLIGNNGIITRNEIKNN